MSRRVDSLRKDDSVLREIDFVGNSFWGENVMQLPDGHVEICASEPVPIGTTPPENDVPSQVVELKNGPTGPVIVWLMTVKPGGTYRSYRIGSLYPGVVWPG